MRDFIFAFLCHINSKIYVINKESISFKADLSEQFKPYVLN